MKNTKTLVTYALLTAIIILMSLTPIGYLKLGVVEISFLMIPVVIGAITEGPKAGAFLGGVFGLTSFFQALSGSSAFGAALVGISAFGTFVLCFVPRILAGFLSGCIFTGLKKVNQVVSYGVSALSGALLNTLFFVTAMMLIFGQSGFITKLQGGKNVIAFLAAFVGVNGIVEAICCMAVGGAVAKAVNKSLKKG